MYDTNYTEKHLLLWPHVTCGGGLMTQLYVYTSISSLKVKLLIAINYLPMGHNVEHK